jgi:hypothetical protein
VVLGRRDGRKRQEEGKDQTCVNVCMYYVCIYVCVCMRVCSTFFFLQVVLTVRVDFQEREKNKGFAQVPRRKANIINIDINNSDDAQQFLSCPHSVSISLRSHLFVVLVVVVVVVDDDRVCSCTLCHADMFNAICQMSCHAM